MLNLILFPFTSNQEILSEDRLTFKFLDVVTILLNYCGPKLAESENKEMKAVIRDLIVIIGYFVANNKKNQVRLLYCSIITFLVAAVINRIKCQHSIVNYC